VISLESACPTEGKIGPTWSCEVDPFSRASPCENASARDATKGVSVPHRRTSGAEARLPFPTALRHDWKSCPSRSCSWRDLRLVSQLQQQVPRRAFGPVRNDKGCWAFRGAGSAAPPLTLRAALKRRSFTVVLAAREDILRSKSRTRSTSTSKATERIVRPTRATPTPKAPGFARWTAGGGCPHIYLRGLSPASLLLPLCGTSEVVPFPGFLLPRVVNTAEKCIGPSRGGFSTALARAGLRMTVVV